MVNYFLINSPYHYELSKMIMSSNDNSKFIIVNEIGMEYIMNNEKNIFIILQKFNRRGERSVVKKIIEDRDIAVKNREIIYINFNKIRCVDRLYVFTDEVITHQMVIKYFKEKYNCEVILIDEGTVLYYRKSKIKALVKNIIKRIIGFPSHQIINYGENKYLDKIYVLNPEKAKIDKKNLHKVHRLDELITIDFEKVDIKIKKNSLLIIGTIFNDLKKYEIMHNIIEYIVKSSNKIVYFKPHPRENDILFKNLYGMCEILPKEIIMQKIPVDKFDGIISISYSTSLMFLKNKKIISLDRIFFDKILTDDLSDNLVFPENINDIKKYLDELEINMSGSD